MTKSLDELRLEINAIDHQILELITARSNLLTGVLRAKQEMGNEQGIMVYDPRRESEIIRKLVAENNSVLPDSAVGDIFQAIISACRNLQIANLKNAKLFTVSIQGGKGSYSECALLQYCQQKGMGHTSINYAVSSANVLADLKSQKSDYGLVALNNSQGGLVSETIKALRSNRYLIIDSVVLKVNHSLLALDDLKKDKIDAIYSHPQALKQCREYLKANYPECKIVSWEDTATAAIDLLDGKIPRNSAVIAHENCAVDTNLRVVDRNIQDLKADNETLFLLIKGQTKHE